MRLVRNIFKQLLSVNFLILLKILIFKKKHHLSNFVKTITLLSKNVSTT